MEFDEESLYSYTCDCGADFPLVDNRINDKSIQCPACGRKFEVPKDKTNWFKEED